jgi:hypothetical protein
MKLRNLALSLVFLSAASWTMAQDTTSAPDPKSKVRTITGCLSKGDSADEFLLTGTNASTWEVRSTKVALGDHVGHEIRATGVVSHQKLHNMKEDAKDMAADSGMKKDTAEHGHMTITKVKMVSDSCK